MPRDTDTVQRANGRLANEGVAPQVVLGEHDVSAEEGTEQRRQLSQVVFFRGQLGDSRSPRSSPKNDIALIQLDREAIYNEWVKPIALPEADDVFTGERATAGVAAGQTHRAYYLKVSFLMEPLVPKIPLQNLRVPRKRRQQSEISTIIALKQDEDIKTAKLCHTTHN